MKCPFTEPCLMGRKSGDRNEREYLRSIAVQLTEEEQLTERGYIDPLWPDGDRRASS